MLKRGAEGWSMLKFLLIIVLAATTISGCEGTSTSVEKGSSTGKDEIFIKNLRTLIGQADRIVVTEHSIPFDLYDTETSKSLIVNEIIYRTKDLNSWRRYLLKAMAISASSKGSGLKSFCIFQPHHTIHFYADKRLLNKLDICFECGDVSLAGTETSSRPLLISELSFLIENVGFEPKRDWKKLAETYGK